MFFHVFSFWNNGKTAIQHTTRCLEMELLTACQPQMKHHRVKLIVHRVRFNQVLYPPHMFQIRENEKHILPRKCFLSRTWFVFCVHNLEFVYWRWRWCNNKEFCIESVIQQQAILDLDRIFFDCSSKQISRAKLYKISTYKCCIL